MWSILAALSLVFVLVAGSQQQQPLAFEAPSITEHARFEPLKRLPGISPYFDAYGFGLEDSAPLGCNVTAASYLLRHGAIYANDDDYGTYMEPVLEKLNAHRGSWTGPLAVLNGWSSPITNPDQQLEELTPAGAEKAMSVARHLLARYPKLVPTTKKVYSDKKPRTKDTARAFMKAFPQDDIELIQIHREDEEFHSTVPHKACPAFTKAAGQKEMDRFVEQYTTGTLARLKPHTPVKLTSKDIVGLQQWCGYESSITGEESDLCGIFTPTDWMGYEYAWDVKYSYMVGPGQPLAPYLGFPWLNVTAYLFSKFHVPEHSGEPKTSPIPNDDGQRFFLSTTHREVPPLLATALGIFNSSSSAAEAFPTDRINFSPSWRMAELIPFLGHIGIEKMTCDTTSGAPKESQEFVRILANSAPRPIPSCQQGPGASCEYHEFVNFVKEGMRKYGDFQGVCNTTKRVDPITWK